MLMNSICALIASLVNASSKYCISVGINRYKMKGT